MVDDHLAGCGACRAWRESAHRVTRLSRLAPVAEPSRPDPVWRAAVLERAPRRRRPSPGLLRAALVAVAAAQAALTVPLLAFGRLDVTHDLGAVEAALAVAFAMVARRPSRAPGVAPVVGTAAVLLLAMEAVGLADGGGAVLDLGRHLVVLAGWLLLLPLSRPGRPAGEPVAAAPRDRLRHLRGREPGRRLTRAPGRPAPGPAGPAPAGFADVVVTARGA